MDLNNQTEQPGAAQSRARAGRNPADNLTQEDRVRGGQRSAGSQVRGPKGQFAGSVRRMGDDSSNSRSDQTAANGNGMTATVSQQSQQQS
jgi:hypothetical protein